MNENFSDELISAYLDGELTPEEQAEVERELRDNPESRRMFDELRSLRSNLQSLPRFTLDDAFAQRVMRRAERVMLTPQKDAKETEGKKEAADANSYRTAPASKVTPASTVKPMDEDKIRLEMRRWRRLFWSAATLAAGLLVALFAPDRTPSRVAVQNSSTPLADPQEDGWSNRFAEKSSSPSVKSLVVEHKPEVPSRPGVVFDPESGTQVVPTTGAGKKEREFAIGPASAKSVPQSAPATVEKAKLAETQSPPPPNATRSVMDLDASQPSLAGNRKRDVAEKQVDHLNRLEGSKLGAKTLETKTLGDAPGSAENSNPRRKATSVAGDSSQAVDRNAIVPLEKANPALAETSAALRTRLQQRPLSGNAGDLVVVRLKMAAGDVKSQKQTVETLLAKNNIDVVGARDLHSEAEDASVGRPGNNSSSRSQDKQQSPQSLEGGGFSPAQPAPRGTVGGGVIEPANGARRNAETNHRAQAIEPLDVFYVEATPQQVAATLEDLSQLQGAHVTLGNELLSDELAGRDKQISMTEAGERDAVRQFSERMLAERRRAGKVSAPVGEPGAKSAAAAPVTEAIPEKESDMKKSLEGGKNGFFDAKSQAPEGSKEDQVKNKSAAIANSPTTPPAAPVAPPQLDLYARGQSTPQPSPSAVPTPVGKEPLSEKAGQPTARPAASAPLGGNAAGGGRGRAFRMMVPRAEVEQEVPGSAAAAAPANPAEAALKKSYGAGSNAGGASTKGDVVAGALKAAKPEAGKLVPPGSPANDARKDQQAKDSAANGGKGNRTPTDENVAEKKANAQDAKPTDGGATKKSLQALDNPLDQQGKVARNEESDSTPQQVRVLFVIEFETPSPPTTAPAKPAGPTP